MNNHNPNLILVYSVLILVQVLFGINFITSKIVLQTLSPYSFAFWRFFLSGLILLSYALAKKIPFPSMNAKDFRQLIILSLLGVSLGQILVLSSLRYTSPTNVSLLLTTIPLFTLFISCLRREIKISFSILLGMALTFFGVLILKGGETFHLSSLTLRGDLLALATSFVMATFISFSKSFFVKCQATWGSTLLFLCGSVLLLPFNLNENLNIFATELARNNTFYSCLLFSIVGATLLTYFLNNWAIKFTGPTQISLFIYLQPLVTALVAVSFQGEHITGRLMISAFAILGGMVGVLKAPLHFPSEGPKIPLPIENNKKAS